MGGGDDGSTLRSARGSSPARVRGSKKPGKKDKGKAASKDAGEAFRVAVRCRPLLPHERGKDSGVLTLTQGTVTVNGEEDEPAGRTGTVTPRVASPRRERSDQGLRTVKSFSFDHVYDEFCTQDEVYAQFVAPFTARFLEGYNVTLFAYGQTGTGKTHTVIGGETYEQRGIVPRFVEEVFAHVAAEAAMAAKDAEAGQGAAHLVFTEAESAEAKASLSETRIEKIGVTILEVYDGRAFDLLTPDRSHGGVSARGGMTLYGTQLPLEMEPAAPGRASADGTRCYWVRGGERVVRSAAEALTALRDSLRLRHTASHALNDQSSRSHCIFSLQVHKRRQVYKLERVERDTWRYVLQPARTTALVTRANLVDLAGSEDARETLAGGSTLREAGEINKSLFTLRKAIEHLALKKHTRSVFQEETLTKMLASSLLGQAYSLMIATISPSAANLRHTRNTLHYAGTASSISLAAPKAAVDDLELRNAELEKRNKKLLKELEQRGRDYGAQCRAAGRRASARPAPSRGASSQPLAPLPLPRTPSPTTPTSTPSPTPTSTPSPMLMRGPRMAQVSSRRSWRPSSRARPTRAPPPAPTPPRTTRRRTRRATSSSERSRRCMRSSPRSSRRRRPLAAASPPPKPPQSSRECRRPAVAASTPSSRTLPRRAVASASRGARSKSLSATRSPTTCPPRPPPCHRARAGDAMPPPAARRTTRRSTG